MNYAIKIYIWNQAGKKYKPNLRDLIAAAGLIILL